MKQKNIIGLKTDNKVLRQSLPYKLICMILVADKVNAIDIRNCDIVVPWSQCKMLYNCELILSRFVVFVSRNSCWLLFIHVNMFKRDT